jgi:hypothetical protein
MRIVISILSNHPLAQIRMPTADEVASLQQVTTEKYSSLPDVWGTCDRVKLHFESTTDPRIQRMYYNGWTHRHCVSNIFVFAMDGTIQICGLNAPGTMHDSSVSDYSFVYERLKLVYDLTGGKVVIDSAFRAGTVDFLVKSAQTVPMGNGIAAVRARAATLIRQSAEWGMKQFQQSFLRIKDNISFETHGERRIILCLFVHLYNFITNCVGCNQIRSTFMPQLEANWFNARSMFVEN